MTPQTYLWPFQTSMMVLCWDVCQDPKYVSGSAQFAWTIQWAAVYSCIFKTSPNIQDGAFCENSYGFQPLAIYAESSILDVHWSSEYVSKNQITAKNLRLKAGHVTENILVSYLCEIGLISGGAGY